jgi:hypothetical protein
MENKICPCGNHIFDDNIRCFSCFTRLTSVIVSDGCDGAIYITSNQWKEYETYKELKKKWDWMD